MQALKQNLRFALRMLGRNPGLTATVLLTLALGIGANTAIFTVDYATLLAPLPFPHPNQLVMVWSKIQTYHNAVAAGDFLDWKRQSTAFADLNAWSGQSFNVATKDQPEYIQATATTPGLLQMEGESLFLGRYFLPEEGTDGHQHVAILTHKLWLKLGGSREIVGTNIRLDGEPYTVVGVQQAGDQDRGQNQLTVPLVFKPDQINHDFHWLLVMGRLKPGVTLAAAQENMNAVTAHIANVYPKSDKGWGSYVEQLKDDFLPKERIQMLWMLMGAVGFVLLIACVNVANLLLARGMARQKELAVRSAVGAGRGTIFGQLITESLLLALAGGALGVGVGYGMLQGLIAVMPQGTLPNEANLTLNVPILLFTLGVTTLAGVLAGSAPAWYASRVDPAESLKEGGRTGTSAGKHRLRRILVVGEFTLALVLLAGAGLAIHSFWNLTRVDLGVKTDHVLTFFLPVPDSRSKDPAQITAYYRDILARVDAVPGVEHASASTGLPLYGAGFGMPFTLVGGPTYADPSQRPGTGFGMVTPDFFSTYGVRLVKGRELNDQDTASSVKVAVVNEDFVKKYLQGKDPLRQQISVEQLTPGLAKLGPPQDWQIVGVFHNVRAADQRDENPQMLIPFWQIPWPQAAFGVRTAESPLAMERSIAAAVHSVDPEIALAEPKTLDQVRDETMANEWFTLILFATFAVVALLLAALGIYGVMAFSVAQRSHEIALRMALGATRHRVVALVVREGALLAAIGLGLGLVAAFFVGRAMQSMLFGVKAMDVPAFASVGAILLVTALLACWVPAQRAAGTEPMKVLRTE
ncbi:MAG TPA: ABC transporter permease [Acidobacteriaceae bacterium]|jgi:putative ABC transport system permease protein|nr:ABC transporter permease [Acidobacteriaceae bacterium]